MEGGDLRTGENGDLYGTFKLDGDHIAASTTQVPSGPPRADTLHAVYSRYLELIVEKLSPYGLEDHHIENLHTRGFDLALNRNRWNRVDFGYRSNPDDWQRR